MHDAISWPRRSDSRHRFGRSSPTRAWCSTSSAGLARRRTKSPRRTFSPGLTELDYPASSRARSRSAPVLLASATSTASL